MSEPIDVRLAQGVVTGVREGAVCRFEGIPYGEAPVGSLRFRPPAPAKWKGRLDATKPGPVAPQQPSRLRAAMGDFHATQSEDCLRLTIWTPAPDTARRPVLVWLHGGAFQSGGGALDWYAGNSLSRRGDVVVVAINYRLAALGWLYVPGRCANLGLLDQEAAIDWIVDHIGDFGGDPERITVMGQSAGAASAVALLTRSPRFSRVILQSGPLAHRFRPAAQARQLGAVFMKEAGADSFEDLQRVPVQSLLAAQQAPTVLEALKAEGVNRGLFGLVADGEVLAPLDELAFAEAAGRADALVGYTRDEMAAFPGAGRNEESARRGEALFGEPSRQWAMEALERGRDAWLYRFDYGPAPDFGACHCFELPFVFDTVAAFAGAPMMQGVQAPDASRLIDRFQSGWIEFIQGKGPGWKPAPHLEIIA